MADKNKSSEEEKQAFGKVANVAAYPVAAGAGAYAFTSVVDSELRKNLIKIGALDELDTHLEKFKDNRIEKAKYIDTAKDMIDFHKERTEIFKKAQVENGYDSILKKYNVGLHEQQKLKAIRSGISVTGITLGIILTIANSKSLMSRLFDSDDKSR